LFEAGEDGGGEEDLGGLDSVLGFAFFDEVVEFQGGLEDGGAEEAVGVVPGLALGFVERVVEAGVVPLPAVEGSAVEAEALGDGGVGEALEEEVDGLALLVGEGRVVGGGGLGGLVVGEVVGRGEGVGGSGVRLGGRGW
jgi:hypothetical protein